MTEDALPGEESLTVEFKSDLSCLGDDELVEAVVCLANTEGGCIYVGIEDDGRVTGLHHSRPARVDRLSALVANRTSPPLAVTCRELAWQGLRVAMIGSAPITGHRRQIGWPHQAPPLAPGRAPGMRAVFADRAPEPPKRPALD